MFAKIVATDQDIVKVRCAKLIKVFSQRVIDELLPQSQAVC